mgnify:CR=1 FL=1
MRTENSPRLPSPGRKWLGLVLAASAARAADEGPEPRPWPIGRATPALDNVVAVQPALIKAGQLEGRDGVDAHAGIEMAAWSRLCLSVKAIMSTSIWRPSAWPSRTPTR